MSDFPCFGQCNHTVERDEEIAHLRAEVERLKAENKKLTHTNEAIAKAGFEKRQKIKSLEAELNLFRMLLSSTCVLTSLRGDEELSVEPKEEPQISVCGVVRDRNRLRAEVERLTRERDDARRHADSLTGEKFSDRNHTALQDRARRAEAEIRELRQKCGEWAERLDLWADRHSDVWDCPFVAEMREEAGK